MAVIGNCAECLLTVDLVSGDPARASAERRCEPGFYCVGGIKRLFDPGTWGGEFGLVRNVSTNKLQCLLLSVYANSKGSLRFLCIAHSTSRVALASAPLATTAPKAVYRPQSGCAGTPTNTAPVETSDLRASLRDTSLPVRLLCFS